MHNALPLFQSKYTKCLLPNIDLLFSGFSIQYKHNDREGSSMYSIFEDTMADMAWTEIESSIQKGAIVLLPSGVIKQQGPHLATGTDIYVSHLICKKIKHELEKSEIESIIAPPFYWGINHVTGGFPGSFTTRKETMKHVLFDIFACLHGWNVKHVFLIDIHGDHQNGIALYEAIGEGREQLGLDIRSVISHWVANELQIDQDNKNFLIFHVDLPASPQPQYVDVHAGAGGTAMMMKYFPSLVNVQLAKELEATNLTYEELKKWQHGGDIVRQITPLGYVGAPSEFGQVNVDGMDFVSVFSRQAAFSMKEYMGRL
ncbi:creatininase family protein [Paenibacillus jamilae]|uniref:Creatininase family protein n=1 Tax=Paenibacillus alvei TaxID=44250 RepID=A0ABT4ECE8_PAEAL|nr:creatininase family protein [Paenibacillus alvei]MCY9531414.1 creatininase family protein [Paenibacillus alvei]